MVRRLALELKVSEGLADPAGQRHRATVGGTGHGVLLVDHQRHAGQFGRQPAGTGDVAAKPQHADRTQLADDAARPEQRADQLQRSLSSDAVPLPRSPLT